MSDLYHTDFHAWTQEQAAFLRNYDFNRLDVENLSQEIEALGQQKHELLVNCLEILLGNLLIWQYQPEARDNQRLDTIREQRDRLQKSIERNPSFASELADAIPEAYSNGVKIAMREGGASSYLFPETCSYLPEEVIEDDFFPS